MFETMDSWDVALLAVATYIALIGLVRLMLYHRNKLVAQFRAEVQVERGRQAEAARAQAEASRKAAARENAA